MRVLSDQPIIDKLVFRYNLQHDKSLRELFGLCAKHWEEIPYGLNSGTAFQVSRNPADDDNPVYRPSRNNRSRPDSESLYLREIPDELNDLSTLGHSGSIAQDVLRGRLRKAGNGFRRNFLFRISGLGWLYITSNSIRLTVDSHELLRAQTAPADLQALLDRVSDNLQRVFGFVFFISDLDLAVDVAARPEVMDDLRLSMVRKNFATRDVLGRHRITVWEDGPTTDRNGFDVGSQSSRYRMTVYDYDLRLQHMGPRARRALLAKRRILDKRLYDRRRICGHHVIRFEFKLGQQVLWSAASSASEPTVDNPLYLPTKADWQADPTKRTVHFDEVDRTGVFARGLDGIAILQSNLAPFRRYKTAAAKSREGKSVFLPANLCLIRDGDPERWETMLHPLYRTLRDHVMGQRAIAEAS